MRRSSAAAGRPRRGAREPRRAPPCDHAAPAARSGSAGTGTTVAPSASAGGIAGRDLRGQQVGDPTAPSSLRRSTRRRAGPACASAAQAAENGAPAAGQRRRAAVPHRPGRPQRGQRSAGSHGSRARQRRHSGSARREVGPPQAQQAGGASEGREGGEHATEPVARRVTDQQLFVTILRVASAACRSPLPTPPGPSLPARSRSCCSSPSSTGSGFPRRAGRVARRPLRPGGSRASTRACWSSPPRSCRRWTASASRSSRCTCSSTCCCWTSRRSSSCSGPRRCCCGPSPGGCARRAGRRARSRARAFAVAATRRRCGSGTSRRSTTPRWRTASCTSSST